MADDLLGVLTRFHREVVLPDIERVIDSRVAPLREEMLGHFDALFKRLDRIETEYAMLLEAVRRIEHSLNDAEQASAKLALRSELNDLKARVHALEARIADLEAEV